MKCEQKYVDWTEIAMYHDLEIRYL
jgi:hypothetical protein